MSDLVQFTKHDNIAIITINNPPVNALTHPGVPDGIAHAIQRTNEDAGVRAAVVIGAGRTFISGADLGQFQEITSGNLPVPTILPLLRHIEDSRKPVVMAIHGAALGGGLEVALAGHYRVAAANAQAGQTEVRFGLIPGASGTQRLPRLVGVAKAAEMCAEGTVVQAPEALKFGLIDRIIEGDLLAGAVAFAREVADQPVVKTRDRNDKLGAPQQNAPIFTAARDSACKKMRGLKAPLMAIDAVEAATKLPFEEGCQFERDLFARCLFSDQSKALIYVFFGEREVAKVPGVPAETPVLPVNTAGVIGAGTMGGGIAMVFANAGIPVLVKDADQAMLDHGMGIIRKNYAASVKRGRFTQQFVDERLKLIKPVLSYDDFAQVDLVVEAVFESMALKRQVFGELDRVCRPGAILASNTSTLNLDQIAAATARPQSVIGTHFFSPANVMRLLEIVRGRATSREVIATCMQMAKKLRKIGVLVGNCRGFVGNRMVEPYRREAQFLVEEGASPEAVDQALVEYGMAMGPLAMGDMAGLDMIWRTREEVRKLEEKAGLRRLPEDRLFELKRYGQKTGAGWYKYDDSRRALPDPEVAELVRQWAAEAGILQRPIAAQEIVERCIYALVNEGARILEEGYAARAVDIDTIYINGYGFPAYRGGPMWCADSVGLRKVYSRICDFHQQHGKVWEPAPLLQRLAEDGKSFAEFRREMRP